MALGSARRLWNVANCTISDPPDWLTKNTRAWFQYRKIRSYEYKDWTVVTAAVVDEITIVSPAFRPVDASARVEVLKAAEAERSSPSQEVSTNHLAT